MKVDVKLNANHVTLEDFRLVSEFQSKMDAFLKSFQEVYPLFSRVLLEIDNFDNPNFNNHQKLN